MPKLKRLSRKQKAFADALINDKTISATQAVIEAGYDVANSNTARVIASENLSKPSIQLYLDEHVNVAKGTILALTGSEKDDIRLRASQDILDRTLGKAVQRQQIETRGVSISIDLSGTPPTDGV